MPKSDTHASTELASDMAAARNFPVLNFDEFETDIGKFAVRVSQSSSEIRCPLSTRHKKHNNPCQKQILILIAYGR
jgi:hypothetical protein